MLTWICAECGSPTESKDVESIDTGTDLVCEYCHKHSVVELHTVEGYRKANEMVLQIREMTESRDYWQRRAKEQLDRVAEKQTAWDETLRLNGEYRKALEEIGAASLCASTLGFLRRKIEESVAPILPTLLEKPKSDCLPDCSLCMDVRPGDVHGCSCHAEKRKEPS